MSSVRDIEPKAITVTIDGKECQGVFGDTILEIARANGIYIPTMCYLTKVLPIASCRMCVVNVEGVDGMILSCQEKATDGAVINTQSAELYKERQNIMKLYNVNHPLECGVCDKSGECDLQNKTMEFGITDQSFTARESSRPVQNWGAVSYDPALCIMCEKCVRVSTEITGDEAIKVKFGGYSSTIENVKPDTDHKTLGEAAAVCPVGALVDTGFKYRTNAWELQKIPSSCPHCGGGHELIYEVKGGKIYRVSNNAEFSTLCSASRYGYDFANEGVTKDDVAFTDALQALESAGSICFSSQISNEEALILQKLKEERGYKLISPEAHAYQKFMQAYSSITGKLIYGGNLDRLSNSRVVIVMGTRINDDAPIVKYHINMASKWHRSRVIYMHPMEDGGLQNIVTQFIKYEAGSEEGVAALLADTLLKESDLPKGIKKLLEDLDIGNLSAESNVGEEELQALANSMIKRVGHSLVVGSDLYSHPRAENIAKFIALIEKYAGFNVICVPPAGNALGVSLICDLDDEAKGSTVGYNVKGDFTLSALGDGDLDMPAMSQQEGTLTGFNKRVVPMNVAVDYGGYVLNDLANALGLSAEYTIDYTVQLPTNKGYRTIEFDSLPDHFDTTGIEHRGYLLNEVEVAVDESIEEPLETEGIDGAVIYNCNPQEHFSVFTGKSKNLLQDAYLVGSEQFATAAKLKDGESVSFEVDGVQFDRLFRVDTSLKGTIALNPTFDMGLSAPLLSSYRFCRLEKAGS